jgi:hypothetical protein
MRRIKEFLQRLPTHKLGWTESLTIDGYERRFPLFGVQFLGHRQPRQTPTHSACSGKKSNSPSSSPDAINRPLTRIRHDDSRHRNRNAQYLVGPSSKDFQALRRACGVLGLDIEFLVWHQSLVAINVRPRQVQNEGGDGFYQPGYPCASSALAANWR